MSCHVCARTFMKYMRCGEKSRHSGSYGGSLYQMESKTYISVLLKIRFEIGVSICCFLCLFVCFETEDGNGSVAGVRLYQMTGYTHRSLGQRFGGR